MIILDTDTVIYFLNGVPSVVERATRSGLERLAVASPTVGELYYGAFRSKQKDANLKKIDDLTESMIVLSLDIPVLRRFGELKSHLSHRGRPVGDIDTFIAATALIHRATLVTHNTRHFSAFTDLELEDWYRPNGGAPVS